MPPIKSAKRFVKKAARRAGCWKDAVFDRSPKLLVPVFHRIVPSIDGDPLNIMVSEKKFIRLIDALATRYPVISLSDAAGQAKAGRPKARCQVVVTFDDGYRDNHDVAFPILKRKGVPAAFFVATDYIGADAPLWDLSLISMVLCNRIDGIDLGDSVFRKRAAESRRSFAFRVLARIKSVEPEKRSSIMGAMRARIVPAIPLRAFPADRCLTWDEARAMLAAGMEFGSHGMSHTSLAKAEADSARREIGDSKLIIERNLHRPCEHFAFPFGSRRDYNNELIRYVREAGYKTCLLNVHGFNRLDGGCFCLKRIIMDEFTDERHIFG
jgi:peptidoglycan/xylan/chitin deacetylase (PgdA/CDA1 family)